MMDGLMSLPSRERELKFDGLDFGDIATKSLPSRERELKSQCLAVILTVYCRSLCGSVN